MTNMTDDEIKAHLREMAKREQTFKEKYESKQPNNDRPTFKENIAHVIKNVPKNIPKNVPKNIPDIINSPSHYTSGGIETIDYMEAKSTPEEFRGHLRLTALKYLSRAGLKENTLQDLKKAQWYVNALIEFIEDSNDRV
jgi:hypothetical protein